MGGEILTQRRRAAECAKGSWKLVRLGELCSKIGSGATPSGGKNAYREDGISLIRSQNVLDFSFSTNGLAFINEERARKLDGVTVKPKDVLLNITGDSVARVCIVPDSVLPARVNQHVCILRPRENVLDSGFLAATLISIKQQLLLMAGSGATRNALTKGDISELKILLPPLTIQRKIAAVLGALDDKIENNRKICANLEAQAQAIFKSWFVDFEPFGGKMPQGWKMGKLGDVAELMRQIIAPNEMVEVVEHYSLPAYDEARYPAYDNSDNIKSNKFKVGKDSILVSKLNPAIKRLWDPFVDTETAVASTEFVVINPRDTRNRYFVYGVLDSPAFYAYAKSNVSGTTNSHQRISPEQILCFETVLPDGKWIEKFCDAVSPMYWGIKKRIKESRALAAMRDALLPKLMSGEIDVEKVKF